MKVLRYFVMMLFALCAMLPAFATAEAAGIALLPLINNVADREDLGQMYYDRAVSVVKNTNGYEIIDNTELDKAIAQNVKPNTLPDQAACEALARDGGVDLVIMMEANELSTKETTNQQSSFLDIKLRGNMVVYNAMTGKYEMKKIADDNKMDTAFAARYDVVGDTFANEVTRQIKRILGVKKISFEKPRISAGGLRGNH